ncbi:MAG: hypothetical protein EF806_01680 [Candidatus Methanoliparum thermophilum]|uniref:Uncharacterized protein n=1 Tax=Methanoliparum thermophilum TaxID=2491083 RepID=A0A520KTF4_METT2|nr:MAG: hypothetical protein EF806_01680 [Candidatus Methanoliparum thermophilum]
MLLKVFLQDEKRSSLIIHVYAPIALIGILFFGPIITPSYYTLIFLGVLPFFFLLLNGKISRRDVKKSFLYSLPLLWPFVADLILGLYKYGPEVLSHWQWYIDPSTLSSLEIFDSCFWHPFVILSFSMNFFFLCIVQSTLQKHVKPEWAILATTCIWISFFLGFMWVDGSLPGSILGIAFIASFPMICSFAFYKSESIVGQVVLLGISMLGFFMILG